MVGSCGSSAPAHLSRRVEMLDVPRIVCGYPSGEVGVATYNSGLRPPAFGHRLNPRVSPNPLR